MKKKMKKKLFAKMCYLCGGKYAKMARDMLENDLIECYVGIGKQFNAKGYEMRFICANGCVWGFPIKCNRYKEV